MHTQLPPLKDLHFGQLDAGEEANDEPLLLTNGYFDYKNAAYGATQGHIWLVIGPKGSGKSAVLEHIRLSWEERHDRFFSYWNLNTFPIVDITTISSGLSVGSSRAQSSWEFLLWLRIAESLSKDEGITAKSSFVKMIKSLKERGYIEGDWLSRVSRWTGGTLKIDAKIFSVENRFNETYISPLEMSAYIRSEILAVTTSSRHIVSIDGLDSFFFEADNEWSSLAGLMQAMSSVNKELSRVDLPIRILTAVRSDILDVLPGPEINKLKTHSVYLDWHKNGIGARNELWDLVTRKAQVSKPEVTNIVSQYLKKPFSKGPHTEMAEYLLDNTRLLPRDLVALLTHLQREFKRSGPVPQANALRAVNTYCSEYFVGEIFDNLAGILPTGHARQLGNFKDALRTAPSRRFNFDYMTKELDGELSPSQIRSLLKQMFETGGIGIQNGRHTDFVFRQTSGGGFSTRYTFLLHDALVRAWNRPWSDDRAREPAGQS
ncbi:P-loop ATPase, Sll1717 family [Arthrobacter sp. IK3]|uniref:P-loop ATPase, Sll1717 family n=1 Tax=Arthrobacter sp. IK3 TaxID=3448169 RepID=UPI003EE21308